MHWGQSHFVCLTDQTVWFYMCHYSWDCSTIVKMWRFTQVHKLSSDLKWLNTFAFCFPSFPCSKVALASVLTLCSHWSNHETTLLPHICFSFSTITNDLKLFLKSWSHWWVCLLCVLQYFNVNYISLCKLNKLTGSLPQSKTKTLLV